MGWCSGVIEKANGDKSKTINGDMVNFEIYYETDDDLSRHVLVLDKYRPDGPANSWVLLEHEVAPRTSEEADRQWHVENTDKATADDASAERVAVPSTSRKELRIACPQVDEGGDDINHREGGGTIEVSQQMTLDQLRAMILEEFDEDQCARSYPPSLLTPSLSPHPTSNTLSDPNPPSLARTAESRTAAHARAGCPRVSRAVPSSTSASRASVSPRRKKPARGRGSAATAASSCVPRDRALPRPPSPYQPPPRQPPSCSPLLSRLPPPRLLLRPSLCQERLQCRLPSRPRSLLPYAPIPPRRWRPSRPR